MRPSPRRGGFAAALAVCFLASLAGVAAASFYTVVEARRSANRAARREQAAAAADVELFAALDAWSAKALDSLPIGSAAPGSTYVTRLTDRLYWVAAAGEAAAGTSVEAVRIHSLVLEMLRPAVPVNAAITSAGAVLARPDAVIDGSDSHPPDWTDCPPADTASAPAVVTSGDSATYERLGRMATAALAARADITVPAGAIVSPRPDLTGRCDGGDSRVENWGEPARVGSSPCEGYFPVVHALGGLDVASGRGQGILVVHGRLRVEGPFVFNGVVIARGGIEARGSGVSIYGAVLSADPRGVVWEAGGQVRRSTCAVARASGAAARPYAVPLRAWAELF